MRFSDERLLKQPAGELVTQHVAGLIEANLRQVEQHQVVPATFGLACVGVVGAGAMGCLFGGLLKEGGLDVTLVDVRETGERRRLQLAADPVGSLSDLDVIEIDGASNRGIDEIRELDPDDRNYPRDERGSDQLRGGDGSDFLYGCKGRDSYRAGDGSDSLNTRDRTREPVRCSTGRDLVYADAGDRLLGCARTTECTTDNFPFLPCNLRPSLSRVWGLRPL